MASGAAVTATAGTRFVPFHVPSIGEEEIAAVVATLR